MYVMGGFYGDGQELSRVLTRDAHLSHDETVAKMGHPVLQGDVLVIRRA
jgi:hypothetical protein